MTAVHFDVLDGSGGVEIDLGQRIPRMLGAIAISGGSSGSVTDAELANGTPYYIWLSNKAVSILNGYVNVTVSFSGSTMSYSFAPISHTGQGTASIQIDGTLIYGTY